ncbi:MAG TPA: hypothetical protein VGM87_10600 [Roseomonas sp.]|jgi:hypothetical protein
MAEIELLLLDRDAVDGPSPETRFGGVPSVGSGFSWPACKACGGNMQFLGQLRRPGSARLHLVFMCQNDPGLCSEWAADDGGNAVLCAGTSDLVLADPPGEGDVVRATRHGARIEQVQASGYGAAREDWAQRHSGRRREVLGQIGGEAEWLQGDATPSCDHCKKPMRFLAQLETGPDHRTEMNFAGGCGYVFECDCPGGSAKFLWQS